MFEENKKSDPFEAMHDNWVRDVYSLSQLESTFKAGDPKENALALVSVVSKLFNMTQNGWYLKDFGQRFTIEALMLLGKRDFPLDEATIQWPDFVRRIASAIENKSTQSLLDANCPAYQKLCAITGLTYKFDPRISNGVDFSQMGFSALLLAMPDFDMNFHQDPTGNYLLSHAVMASQATDPYIRLMIGSGADVNVLSKENGRPLHHLNFITDLGAYSKFKTLVEYGVDASELLLYKPHEALELEEYFDEVPESFGCFCEYMGFLKDAISESTYNPVIEIVNKAESCRLALDELQISQGGRATCKTF